MHLGEKGFWNKWTLFDEATRVPLIVVDPAIPSPSRGLHYPFPVELLDIFPTLLDMFPSLLRCPPAPASLPLPLRSRVKCPSLQGKSLARVIYSLPVPGFSSQAPTTNSFSQPFRFFTSSLSSLFTTTSPKLQLPKLNMTFAVSQVLKCAKNTEILKHANEVTQLKASLRGISDTRTRSTPIAVSNITNPWRHCVTTAKNMVTDDIVMTDETSLMGYSFRLRDFQYIIWWRYDRQRCRLQWQEPPYAEEYYKLARPLSHRAEDDNFATSELRNVNVFNKVDVAFTTRLRRMALAVVKKKRFFQFKNCH